MEQLTIIGSEDDRLILADESGQRFTLAIDSVLRSEVRSHGRDQRPAAPTGASPRDIQARIRAGLSAEETAELLSADIESVRRFEGPVLAEREHMVDRALAVPVVIGTEFDVEDNPTFGSAVRTKLAELQATAERWSSWKDDSGWTVKLEFTANEVDHDARWSFEPRRSALAPINSDATQLSRQGPLPEGLIPRLRALDGAAADDAAHDAGTDAHEAQPAGEEDEASTVDLLEALRRRRGQREAAPMSDVDSSAARHPAKGTNAPLALFDAIGETQDDDAQDGSEASGDAETQDDASDTPEAKGDSSRKRGGRAAMPSWDEIVFGARSDD